MADWKKTDASEEVPEGLKADLAALDERKRKGELTAFEYAAQKKALLKGVAPAKKEEPPAAADAKPAAAPAAKEEEKKVKMPEAWATKEKARKAGPKVWKEGDRTDDPTKRVIHEPLGDGVGKGKSFLFLFGFKIHSPRDQEFLEK